MVRYLRITKQVSAVQEVKSMLGFDKMKIPALLIICED